MSLLAQGSLRVGVCTFNRQTAVQGLSKTTALQGHAAGRRRCPRQEGAELLAPFLVGRDLLAYPLAKDEVRGQSHRKSSTQAAGWGSLVAPISALGLLLSLQLLQPQGPVLLELRMWRPISHGTSHKQHINSLLPGGAKHGCRAEELHSFLTFICPAQYPSGFQLRRPVRAREH